MKKKVLLLGKNGSGKTSMRSIIFSNYMARDTMNLGATVEVDHSHVRFMGDLMLNLWDCGGQDSFMENYFQSQRAQIFRHVEVLIYIFDIESKDPDKDMLYYESTLGAIKQYSPNAKIYCLVHKMDLKQQRREEIFREKEAELIQKSSPLNIQCFPTSIWDESLYHAWSSIVYSLVPNVKAVEDALQSFCNAIEADEIILFEKATFLIMARVGKKNIPEHGSLERLSQLVKHFKLSCTRAQTSFDTPAALNHNVKIAVEGFKNVLS